jgi:hypothetical protein
MLPEDQALFTPSSFCAFIDNAVRESEQQQQQHQQHQRLRQSSIDDIVKRHEPNPFEVSFGRAAPRSSPPSSAMTTKPLRILSHRPPSPVKPPPQQQPLSRPTVNVAIQPTQELKAIPAQMLYQIVSTNGMSQFPMLQQQPIVINGNMNNMAAYAVALIPTSMLPQQQPQSIPQNSSNGLFYAPQMPILSDTQSIGSLSDGMDMSPPPTHQTLRRVRPVDPKKDFLERNRLAASKCRQKRKEWLKNLEQSCGEEERMNTQLKRDIQSLQDEVVVLKGQFLQHQHMGCNGKYLDGRFDGC